MNDYWNYLAHAQKAKERDDHKYIERVPIGTNKGKTIYRYFYTEQEYQAYLNKKESEKKSTGANTNGSLKKVAGEVLKKAAGDKTDSRAPDSKIGVTIGTYASPIEKLVMDGKRFVRKASKAIKAAWNKRNGKNAKEFVLDVVDRLKDEGVCTLRDKNECRTSEVGTRARGNTYRAKVELPNGSFKYFYSTDDYEQYLRRQEYQKESPDFMKDIPRIDEYDFENKQEAMGEVNKENDITDHMRNRNGACCTAAYELRMRGYDVHASDRSTDEEYQGKVPDLYKWYVEPEYKILGQWDGADLSLVEKYMNLKYTMTDKDSAVRRAKEEYDDAKKEYEAVRKAVLKAEGLVGLSAKSETMLKAEVELKAASEKYQEAKAALEEAEAELNKVVEDDELSQQMTIYNDLLRGDEEYTPVKLRNDYDTIEAELKSYPPNSRGSLMISIAGRSSCRSMIWETDAHGRVTIRDARSNEVVLLKEILWGCALVRCARTDNLELKEGILVTVEEN